MRIMLQVYLSHMRGRIEGEWKGSKRRGRLGYMEDSTYENMNYCIKGTGHFFETLSVGSVPGTDHS